MKSKVTYLSDYLRSLHLRRFLSTSAMTVVWRKIFFLIIISSCCPLGCGDSGSGSSSGLKISGSVLVAAGNAIDSDTNDPRANFISNNSFQEAQTISNPAYLGGYVNVAGSGPDGRSKNSGDPDDYFLIDLQAADIIRLAIPGGTPSSDTRLDLKLFNSDDTATPVASATAITSTASLGIDQAGSYYIQVHASSGATIYHLIIGENGLTASGTLQVEKQEFVPGQVLVRLKSEPGMAKSRGFLGSMAWKTAEYSPGRFLLQFEDARQIEAALRSLAGVGKSEKGNVNRQPVSEDATMELVCRLRSSPEVAWAEPNYVRKGLLLPSDPYYALQWNLDLLNFDRAWDLSTGSQDVIVAVIDSGIVSTHPDLAAKLVAGYDFISSATNAGDGDGPDADPEDTGVASPPFHGTHVAGIIGAAFDNGIGISGTGGHTKIMPVRVLGKSGATDADLVQAILFAAGLNPKNNGSGSTLPARPADIINLSLGGPSASQALQDALDQARDAGVIIFAAAGNDGSDALSFPAAANGVVSVAGVDIMGRQGWYSNYGSTIDLAAPGGDLTTDLNRDGYADAIVSTMAERTSSGVSSTYCFYEGTSMAVAHASGVAALMKAVRPMLSPDQFDAYLASGALTFDAGTLGRDDLYGYGILDAARAVDAAGSDPPAILLASPSPLLFESGQESATLYLHSIGSTGITAGEVVADQGWLQVAAGKVNSDGIGSYTVSIDRNGLAGGIHTATISFRTSATNDPLQVPVAVDVLPDPGASTGHLYLLLRNASNTETVTEAEIDPQSGIYSFNFSALDPGTYFLIAGTDLDNDGIINETGEAVGGFGSIFSLEPLEPDATNDNISFRIGFNQRPLNQLTFSTSAGKRLRH